jgi:hypothetical protein
MHTNAMKCKQNTKQMVHKQAWGIKNYRYVWDVSHMHLGAKTPFPKTKHKYWLTNMNIICRLKDQGGLGVEALDNNNKCSLNKWLFRLLNEGVLGVAT